MNELLSATVLLLALSVAWMLWLIYQLGLRIERLERPTSLGGIGKDGRFYVSNNGEPMTLADYLKRDL